MKRWLVAVVATVCAMAAAACTGSSGKPAASPTPSTSTGRYVAALRQLKDGSLHGETTDELQSLDDSELLTLGQTACRYMRHPADHPYGPANEMVGNGYVQEALTALAIARAAKLILCPDAPGSWQGK